MKKTFSFLICLLLLFSVSSGAFADFDAELTDAATELACEYATLIRAGQTAAAITIDPFDRVPGLSADLLSDDAPLLCETPYGMVGFYPEGVYVGGYEGGVRSGHGVWVYNTAPMREKDPDWYWYCWCEAEWADNYPNGAFSCTYIYHGQPYVINTWEGSAADGYYNGAVTETEWWSDIGRNVYVLNYDNGYAIPYSVNEGLQWPYEIGRGDYYAPDGSANIGFTDENGMWCGAASYVPDISIPDGIPGAMRAK